MSDAAGDAFERLFAALEPRLRRALVAAYGPDDGREAAADALAWAWEHSERLDATDNPAGYLWRVAQSTMRRRRRAATFELPQASFEERSDEVDRASSSSSDSWDRALVAALGELTVSQRVAVVLVDAYGYKLSEAADVLGCGVSSLRNHLARGRDSLRSRLEEAT